MAKRMLDCTASDLRNFTKKDYLSSIAASEGRVIACESIGITMPMLVDVTNAEFAASMGADILLLNMFDVDKPVINGLPKVLPEDTVRELKRLTGRMIGINLEPVEERMAAANDETLWRMSEGRKAIITKSDIDEFIEAGADIILLPAPGTVPGITMEYVRALIAHAHGRGALAITAIGTSQEGADTDTIRRIALMCKMAGTDIHHIGDTGYPGMALPENIMTYSVAVRGVRHTYHRMAVSVNR